MTINRHHHSPSRLHPIGAEGLAGSLANMSEGPANEEHGVGNTGVVHPREENTVPLQAKLLLPLPIIKNSTIYRYTKDY